MMKSIGIVVIALLPALAESGGVSASRIREHVKFLSSNSLEGRGVGQRGGRLATEYIATQFALEGLQPAGDDGTYFQKVPLEGVQTAPNAALSASKGDEAVSFHWRTDFVGAAQRQQPDTRFDGESIFVGHGIAAPKWHWDDFKGVDVRGKVLVLFTNEPPSTDPDFFDGRALTYYGRWTYKYEEALRRGALAVLIIHTTPTAGYGWDVVRSSWSGQDLEEKLAPGQNALAFAGWLSRDAGEKLLALSGHHVDELLAAAEKPDFRPIPLGIRIRGDIPATIKSIATRNVAALVPGSDPKLRDQVVVYTAHWDHLGIGDPVKGDDIYNGAVDNATGCGILLELARAWAALPEKPRRSALFLAVTGEEGGLRGSEYYARHPLFPAAQTAIDLNYDAIFPWGRAKDVVLDGVQRTTLEPLAQAVAKQLNLAISPDSEPEQGSYFRSDHFSFAQAGIPAFSIDHATQFAGKPPDYYQKLWQDFNQNHYHQPSDEFHSDWDFTALQQAAEFGFVLGTDIANQDALPNWKPGDEFHR